MRYTVTYQCRSDESWKRGWYQYQENYLTKWGAELIAWIYKHNKNKRDIKVREK